MGLFLQALLVLLVGLLTYVWFSVIKTRRQLKWLPRVPGVPILGNIGDFSKSTESIKTLERYRDKYNGLCYVQFINRFLIIASNAKFLEYILSTNVILEKSRDYGYLYNWLGNGLLTGAGKRWKQSRKIITPAFHFSILEQFVEVFDSNANRMVNRLNKVIDKEIDIYPYVTMYALDVIYETAMGTSINAQESPDSDYIFAVKEMCRITVDRAFSPIKMFDSLYPFTKDYYKEKRYVKVLHSRTQDVIAKRKEEILKQKKKHEDQTGNKEDNEVGVKKKMAFLDLLLQSTIDGVPLPDVNIREEVDTFMFAGHDTTSAAIAFALFALANNPDVQKKVFEEQLQVFDNNLDQPETYRLLQDMKYLELVIKESLRRYPSVPMYSREAAADVVMKDGNVIPKGTTILIASYAVNNDPNVFPDPEKFDPERFNSTDTTKSPYSYLPFSAGPRNCIGQKFALLEIKSILSKVVRHFELLTTEPKHKIILAAETVLKSTNGVKLKLKKRNL